MDITIKLEQLADLLSAVKHRDSLWKQQEAIKAELMDKEKPIGETIKAIIEILA